MSETGERFFSLLPHTPVGRVRLLRHTLPFFLLILGKKPTVSQSRKLGAKGVEQKKYPILLYY